MLRKLTATLFAVALVSLAFAVALVSLARNEYDPTKRAGKVTGKVTYDGKIVPVGIITFHPERGNAVRLEIEGGEYWAEKVPPGSCIVTVSTAEQRAVYNAVNKRGGTGNWGPEEQREQRRETPKMKGEWPPE